MSFSLGVVTLVSGEVITVHVICEDLKAVYAYGLTECGPVPGPES